MPFVFHPMHKKIFTETIEIVNYELHKQQPIFQPTRMLLQVPGAVIKKNSRGTLYYWGRVCELSDCYPPVGFPHGDKPTIVQRLLHIFYGGYLREGMTTMFCSCRTLQEFL